MSTPAVTAATVLNCSFGLAPSSLMVLPLNRVTAGSLPAATLQDNKPLANVLPFGMCSAPANPAVIAATAAALGAPTPAPCVPNIAAPWTPGTPTVTIAGLPALDTACKLTCLWGGLIGVASPGQPTVTVP